jgi:hypothetical protein
MTILAVAIVFTFIVGASGAKWAEYAGIMSGGRSSPSISKFGNIGTAKNTAKMTTANAPNSTFFSVIGNEVLGCTPVGGVGCASHSVAGLGTKDGGFIAAGTFSIPTAVAGAEDDQDGFISKIDSAGKPVWVAKISSLSGSGKYESVLSVAEGPEEDGYAIYGVGVIHTGTSYDRFIAKFDTLTGNRIWLSNFPDSSLSLNGGWEMISMYHEGDAVLSGFAEGGVDMSVGEFKSGGNPENCKMNVAIIKAEALQRATAPTAADLKLDKTYNMPETKYTADQALVSGTAVRALSGGGAVIVSRRRLGSEGAKPPFGPTNLEFGDYSRVIRIDSTGSIIFETDVSVQGEATDIGVDPADEAFYITSGHCAGCAGQKAKTPPWTGIDGSFSRITDDGLIEWTQFHGNPNPLVGDECWGIAMQKDGAVSACGMGVESFTSGPPGCGGKGCCEIKAAKQNAQQQEACGPMNQGNFGGAGWRVENIKVSFVDGSQIWRTVDQFQLNDGEVHNSWENSASEYVASTRDGGIIAFTDNDSGMGFLKLKPTN